MTAGLKSQLKRRLQDIRVCAQFSRHTAPISVCSFGCGRRPRQVHLWPIERAVIPARQDSTNSSHKSAYAAQTLTDCGAENHSLALFPICGHGARKLTVCSTETRVAYNVNALALDISRKSTHPAKNLISCSKEKFRLMWNFLLKNDIRVTIELSGQEEFRVFQSQSVRLTNPDIRKSTVCR